ncbi:MAG: amidohydrolase/deacetylase family metallohydrolase [Anaerolineae bacterium]
MYDLLIANGTVIDPHLRLHGLRHVAIAGGRVQALLEGPLPPALQTLDAAGLLVTPGFIDLHAHFYEGVSFLGVDPDRTCLARGVTTAVDAGTAGAQTFPGLRRYVMERCTTRLYALLNISGMGMLAESIGELLDMRWADPDWAIAVAREHRDCLVGLKVRVGRPVVGDEDLEAVRRTRRAADALGLPIMVHIGKSAHSLADILALLRPDDVVTHCFTAKAPHILDDRGRVMGAAWEGRRRGVRFDVGHGMGSFGFPIAAAALAQGFMPDTISSDLHALSVNGPACDLVTTVLKFWHLGLSLDDCIARVTAQPAQWLGRLGELGTLAPGACADVSLWAVEEGSFPLQDAEGEVRQAARCLVPRGVVKAGVVQTAVGGVARCAL